MNEVTVSNPMVSADLAPEVTPDLSQRPAFAESLTTNAQLHPAPQPSSAAADGETFEAGDEQSDRECYEFQELMSERIVAGQRLQDHPHMLTCDRCRALVRDLEAIADAARQLIPVEVEPKRDLWPKISSAIENGDA